MTVGVRSVAFSLLLPSVCLAWPQEEPFSSVEQIEADFADVPCRNRDRLDGVQALFRAAGATEGVAAVQSYSEAENFLVRKDGRSSETVVIGAHYDLVERGCGALDNWSGVVILAHLYRTIRAVDVAKSVLFVAFGKEETGLAGSRAMVGAIPEEQRPDYCAMINLDSFGVAVPSALSMISSPRLVTLTASVAGRMQLPFSSWSVPGADSDSTAFIESGIPAITLTGMGTDWASILHTGRDQADRVSAVSVYAGYRLALAVWEEVETNPCDAYRYGL